jgi:hypothetical protein
MLYKEKRIRKYLPIQCQRDFEDILKERNKYKNNNSYLFNFSIGCLSLLCLSTYMGFKEYNNLYDENLVVEKDNYNLKKDFFKLENNYKNIANFNKLMLNCKMQDTTCEKLDYDIEKKYLDYGYLKNNFESKKVCYTLWQKSNKVSKEECNNLYNSNGVAKQFFDSYWIKKEKAVTNKTNKTKKSNKKEKAVTNKTKNSNICEEYKYTCKVYKVNDNKVYCKMYLEDRKQRCLINFAEFPKRIHWDFIDIGTAVNIKFHHNVHDNIYKANDYIYHSIKDI